MVWAEGTVLKTAKIGDFLKREKVQGKEMWQAGVASPRIIIDLREDIDEVAEKGGQIIVRTPRIMFILSPKGEIVRKIRMEQEIIGWHNHHPSLPS